MSRTRPHPAARLVALGVVAGLVGCTPASASPDHLTLVGFAVVRAAHGEARESWAATPEGAGVAWSSAFGASGDQSRAVAAGLPADVVHLSVVADVERLVTAGRVDATWDDGPEGGIVSQSVVVLVVRPGNPLGVTDWADLTAPGVEVVTPNPGSSGAARWNVLAAWASAGGTLREAPGGAPGGTPSQSEAEGFLARLLGNVVAYPGSGRDATTAFAAGTGDVLISTENEAILARQRGEDVEYVIPPTTFLVQNPAAVTTDAPVRAQDYLDHVRGPEGQRALASTGFRPLGDVGDVVVPGASEPERPFPEPEHLVTLDDVGGWAAVDAHLFGPDGVVTRLQRGGA